MINYMDIQRVISKYYNPKDRLSEQLWRMYKDPRVQECATWGKVEDNKDPDGYGRLKVRAPLVFGDAVSPWIPMLRPWASNEYGIWNLPDIGDAVVIGFIMRDPTQPFVMGCTYTRRTVPFLEENPENDQKYIRTKSGLEIIMNDKDGEEQLIVSAKDGKMVFLMDTNGIQISNELGDIKIKAKKVTFESENVLVKSSKDSSIKASDGPLDLKASKALAQKASGNLKIKGKKVKLKGSAGVCAGGKQIAKKDDMVVGVDLHDIKVPTNSGLTTVPAIPHPYAGKLADKLSNDVTISDKPVAMKGSKSKYDTPGHICMPPGVKFASNPNNEGEVSSGTEPSVKVNDKEVAVLGSMVKTCNDPQPQETCSIVAVGAAVPIPIMPPGYDPEQYKRDGGFMLNTREPVYTPGAPNSMTDQRSLSSPQWSESKISVGKEVILSVNVQSQQGLRGDVQFKIFAEGADPESAIPVATKRVRKEKGKAEVGWRPQQPGKDSEETEAKFFFVAWAFGCEKVQSGNLTVERELPEFSELKWERVEYDEDGNETSREEVSEIEHSLKANLSAKVENMADGEFVNVFVYEEGYEDPDDFRFRQLVEVKEGMVQAEWLVKETRKRLEELAEDDELKYVFVVEPIKYRNCRSEDSPSVQAVFVALIQISHSKQSSESGDMIYLESCEADKYSQSCEVSKYLEEKDQKHEMFIAKYTQVKPGIKYNLYRKKNNNQQFIDKNITFVDLMLNN